MGSELTDQSLKDYFVNGCKTPDQWRLGTEHELHGVLDGQNFAPVPYSGPSSIAALLEKFAATGWEPTLEQNKIIGLTRGATGITLEPGGQFELANRPVASVQETAEDFRSYFEKLLKFSRELGISWMALGFRPLGGLDDIPWMPKGRYRIMRNYMPKVGSLGQWMMKRTATVQVNIDYSSAEDAQTKMRAIQNCSPVLNALFANSGVIDETPTDYQSFRGHIWLDTDADRCGLLPFLYESHDCFFQRYLDYAQDVPMYFIYRDGEYLDATHLTFRQYRESGLGTHSATMQDWADHLSTLFPEVRMKKFIEIRSCDVNTIEMMLALPAVAKGLLYDSTALHESTTLLAELTFAQREQLAASVSKEGLRAKIPGSRSTVQDIAKQLVTIAKSGLQRLSPQDVTYITPIEDIVHSGRTSADVVKDLWKQGKDNHQRIQLLRENGFIL